MKTSLKKVTTWLSSPEAAATLNVAIAAVAFLHAINKLRDARRKIGFKKELDAK